MRDAMEEESFAIHLLSKGKESDAVANQLVLWADEHPALFEQGLLQQFKSMVEAGTLPRDAAGEVLHRHVLWSWS